MQEIFEPWAVKKWSDVSLPSKYGLSLHSITLEIVLLDPQLCVYSIFFDCHILSSYIDQQRCSLVFAITFNPCDLHPERHQKIFIWELSQTGGLLWKRSKVTGFRRPHTAVRYNHILNSHRIAGTINVMKRRNLLDSWLACGSHVCLKLKSHSDSSRNTVIVLIVQVRRESIWSSFFSWAGVSRHFMVYMVQTKGLKTSFELVLAETFIAIIRFCLNILTAVQRDNTGRRTLYC